MQEVTVRVLGPLRVTVDGAAAEVGSGRRRELLARLAAAGGEVVAVDTLVEDLWQGAPPAQAHGGLQVHVSRLRRVLEPGRSPRAAPTVLVSRPPGYALALGPDGLDARAFTDLLERAATATPDRADALLGAALALWEGPAYAEFSDAAWARAEAERLDELRQVALERRARARLRLGRADAVVPDLTALVGEHPLREDAVGLLAVALYRTADRPTRSPSSPAPVACSPTSWASTPARGCGRSRPTCSPTATPAGTRSASPTVIRAGTPAVTPVVPPARPRRASRRALPDRRRRGRPHRPPGCSAGPPSSTGWAPPRRGRARSGAQLVLVAADAVRASPRCSPRSPPPRPPTAGRPSPAAARRSTVPRRRGRGGRSWTH